MDHVVLTHVIWENVFRYFIKWISWTRDYQDFFTRWSCLYLGLVRICSRLMWHHRNSKRWCLFFQWFFFFLLFYKAKLFEKQIVLIFSAHNKQNGTECIQCLILCGSFHLSSSFTFSLFNLPLLGIDRSVRLG